MAQIAFDELGARYATPRLLSQADYYAGLTVEDADTLGGYGWTPAKTQEILTLRQKVATSFGDAKLAREDTILSTQKRDEIVGAAKLLVRRVTQIAQNAFTLEPEKADDFRIRESLGRTPGRIVLRLETVVKAFEKFQSALAPWGGTPALLAQGKQILGALRDAEKSQDVGIANLPAATREFYVLKGRLYLTIKQAQRSGRAAFADQPVLAARYNLNILYRRQPAAKPTTTA